MKEKDVREPFAVGHGLYAVYERVAVAGHGPWGALVGVELQP